MSVSKCAINRRSGGLNSIPGHFSRFRSPLWWWPKHYHDHQSIMITNLVNAMSQSSQFWWWSLFRSLLKESKIKMSSQAMSHMLCIGYGRFPPQNLTDLWLTIFRWGNVISKLKEDAKMIWGTYTFSEPIHDQNHIIYIKIPIQHDGWSDLLCHVSWACHQPYTGSNTSWSSISSSAYKSGLPSSIETNLDC